MSLFFNKILIVDDFQSMRSIIKDSLKDLTVNSYLEASGGKEALDKLMKSVEDGDPVDLILCDWNMPLFSGLDLLKLIRNSPETQNIPFVMITAESEREKVIDALKSGANDYIIKPLTADVVIRKLINIKKKQQNL
jgi:two-component system, chemotaxis family, chemotaxis protein CheY